MKSLQRRTPVRFNNLPSIFDDLFFTENNLGNISNSFVPAVNIKETENAYEIQMALPGYQKEDIQIKVENELLTISSEKVEESKEEGENFTKQEFSKESFSRSFTLPELVDIEGIEANNEHGILAVTLPKNKELLKDKVKTIAIK